MNKPNIWGNLLSERMRPKYLNQEIRSLNKRGNFKRQEKQSKTSKEFFKRPWNILRDIKEGISSIKQGENTIKMVVSFYIINNKAKLIREGLENKIDGISQEVENN